MKRVAPFLLALTMLSLASCRSGVTTSSRSTSPDGQYATTVKIKDCGAGCSPSATITLHDVNDRIGKGDIEIFDGVGGWPIEVHWPKPGLLAVTFCDGSRYNARSGIFESRIADRGGPLKSVTVVVVNQEDMVVGGKAYCRFPASGQNP
jgi:hypothetical protein